jgi:hypothetical protein
MSAAELATVYEEPGNIIGIQTLLGENTQMQLSASYPAQRIV